MTTITKERIELFIKNPLENGLTRGEQMELARIALASLEREQIRREHAEWSDKTFGDVGPVGPLKHLSKEALETAAEPDDLSEWADMQFLLWDAQRRAGISDEQITLAMVEKLTVNKKREWPEPKDGEPRLHIKEQPAPVVPDEWTIQDAVKFCRETGRQDAGSAMEAWNACRAAMLQGVEQPQNARQNIPENIPDGNSPAIPDDWVMVPRVPTTEMANAMIGVDGCSTSELLVALKLAIAAAPQQEAE
ncbi:DUF550 domain-containing protein [Salmonella enterica]